MNDPKVDELSMMTYLSQYPAAKLKPGAPLKSIAPNPSRVKCYGKGLFRSSFNYGLNGLENNQLNFFISFLKALNQRAI
jgi:hypothetical protein